MSGILTKYRRNRDSAEAGASEETSTIAHRFQWTGGRRTVFGIESEADGDYAVTALQIKGAKVVQTQEGKLLDGKDARVELARLGYRKGAHITLVLSRREAILKWIKIPSSDPGQIARTMPYEIRSLSPWAEDEVESTYEIQGENEAGYTTVLVVLVRHTTIGDHVERLRALGVQLTHIEISTQALRRLLGTCPSGAMLWSGKDCSEYVIYKDGAIVFSHSGGADTSVEDLLREGITLYARNEDHEPMPKTVMLAGGLPFNSEAFADDEISSIPFVTTDLPVLSGASALNTATLPRMGGALAAFEETPGPSLLPAPEARRWALRGLLRESRLAAVATVWCLAVLVLLVQQLFAVEENYVQEIRHDLSGLRSEAGDLEKQWQELELLQGEFRAVSAPLALVLELYERTPATIAISQMHYDSQRGLSLGGEAPRHAEVLSYVQSLRESDLFAGVRLDGSSQPPGGHTLTVDFKISCDLTQGLLQ